MIPVVATGGAGFRSEIPEFRPENTTKKKRKPKLLRRVCRSNQKEGSQSYCDAFAALTVPKNEKQRLCR